MNRKRVRKLQLTSETLCKLEAADLKLAGGIEISQYCPATYTQPTRLCPARNTDTCGNSVGCTYTIDHYSVYDYGCL